MNSSISSSERRAPARSGLRAALVVAGCLLATLILLEVVSRVVLVEASRDLRRFRSYSQAAGDLGRSPSLRLALVGNSATDRGVDAGLLAARLSASLGQPLQAGKFVADASRINDWYHILNHYFWRPGVPADLFLVTFYENDIEDGNAIEIGRMARFFTEPADWPSVFELDLPGIGDRIEFLLASGWASFALRARIRERALGLAVPGYQPFAVALNEANASHLRRQATGRVGPAGYRALDRLLAAARAHGSRLVFVAYPTPAPYQIPAESGRRIAEAGMTLIDLRGLAAELGARRYADDVHLTPEGAALYSGRLADALSPLLPRASPTSAAQADGLP